METPTSTATSSGGADPAARERSRRRVLYGTVVSDRMEKTLTVRVERRMSHPKYGKYIRKHRKYHAHDEQGEAQLGDTVEIVETRPLSKTKRYRLLRVVERPALPETAEGVEG